MPLQFAQKMDAVGMDNVHVLGDMGLLAVIQGNDVGAWENVPHSTLHETVQANKVTVSKAVAYEHDGLCGKRFLELCTNEPLVKVAVTSLVVGFGSDD